jgi:D-ribose pyranose/furanose isomerase RbsD
VTRFVRHALIGVALLFGLGACAWPDPGEVGWKSAVDRQIVQLGHRNWIVIAEASFPAYSRHGVRQVNATVEVPEALDYVLNAMERTENTRPNIYLARELRSMENDYAPGIDELREKIRASLHGHETVQIDHHALLVLLEDANRSFDVLVIRTPTALPYSSVFIELLPGYWDADSESRLRERIQAERMRKISPPIH